MLSSVKSCHVLLSHVKFCIIVGEILLIKSVNRETTAWLNLTVTVHDGTSAAMSSSIDIAVRVKDANDNKPQ